MSQSSHYWLFLTLCQLIQRERKGIDRKPKENEEGEGGRREWKGRKEEIRKGENKEGREGR